MDGGIKLAELGSWSPPVVLGSDVAISPPCVLPSGNNSTANQRGPRVRNGHPLRIQFRANIFIYMYGLYI